MESSLLRDDEDVQAIRKFREQLASKSTIVDFDEQILLPSIKSATRIWRQGHRIVGFAFVDEYNNLWFDVDVEFFLLARLETEIIDWGVTWLKRLNAESGTDHTLDCTCGANDSHRIRVLRENGFVPEHIRSLQYEHPLNEPIIKFPLPSEFSLRCVKGKEEVEQLVELHQAAFGTHNMTVEYRLAMMNAPQYSREMDLVAVSPNGEICAFCVCGFEDTDKKRGFTDPVGTHPSYRKIGLGKALISAGIIALKNAGAVTVRLGTGSENVAMQRLARECGFICVSEKLWFSRHIPELP